MRSSTLALSLALLVPVAAGYMAVQDRLLDDKDLRKLGEALAEYIEARTTNKGVGDAELEVQKEMSGLEKKLSKTPAAGSILASPPDLGRAMWLSFNYPKQRVRKGKVEKGEYEEGFFNKDNPLEYAVWAPSKYAAKSGPYPLIIYIPDQDSQKKPTDHLTEEWESNLIRENVIIAAPKMPDDTSKWTDTDGTACVIVLMRAIYEKYAIDFDRVFLAGRGLGVATALEIAEKFPDRFAGVIGRAGDTGETAAHNFANLPTFFAGGGAKVTAFEEAINDLGYNNCTISPEGKQEDIWNWVQSTTRDAYPDKITLVPGKPFPKRAYWLEVEPSDGTTPGRITASVDRATNTVTVEGEGLSRFILHFNDVIVDMNRPIKVIANGQESQDQVPRSWRTVLTYVFKSICDPGRIFVANKAYDLPPPQ